MGKRLATICFWTAVLFCPPALGHQASPPRHQQAQAALSSWDSLSFLGSYGLTRDLFNQNHLSRLTTQEIINVISAAWLDGMKTGAASITPSCGPTGKNPDRSTVKLFLEVPDAMDSELASALRSRLRAIPDVRLVFSPDDADVTISVLGLPMIAGSGRTVGYTMSYSASRPCNVNGISFDLALSSDMQVDSSVTGVVDGIVSHIDAKVCEDARRWNAESLKSSKGPQ
jgi:hypothetical protein